jgi:hypothetical protein
VNLLAAEAQFLQYRLQKCRSLRLIRATEGKRYSGTPPHSRIERIKPVGTHDDDGREITRCEIVHATNQGVHSRAVLVVHLSKFAGLCKCIGLVD